MYNLESFLNSIPIGGIRIVDDFNIVDFKQREVKRTWKERLFSLPWRPFKKMRIETYTEPSRNIYQFDNVTFVCHPLIAEEIRQATTA